MKRYLIPTLAILILAGLAPAKEEIRCGYLGVETQELNKAMRIALGIENGVLITDVIADSPAEKAGLATGDVILKIDSEVIRDYSDLNHFIRKHPNQKVELTILRTGKEQKLEATLGERERKTFEKIYRPEDWETGEWEKFWKEYEKSYEEQWRKAQKELKRAIEQLKKGQEELKKALKEMEKRLKDKGI